MMMIASFIDGPGMGQVFQVERSPLVLRFVRDETRGNYVCDQINAAPEIGGQIHVYRLALPPQLVLVDRTNERGNRVCQPLHHAAYRIINTPGLADVTLRTNELWRAWCQDNFDAITAPLRDDPAFTDFLKALRTE